MGTPDRLRPSVTLALAFASLLLLTAILALIGLNGWLIHLVAPLPWMWLARRRFGGFISLGLGVLGSWLILLMTLMITATIGAPALETVITVLVVNSGTGIAICVRRRAVIQPISRRSLATLLSPAVGTLGWAIVMVASLVRPGASHIGWAMNGDAASNVRLARTLLQQGGVPISLEGNVVPLPSAIVAIVMASGRDELAPADVTGHDLLALASTWGLLIVLTCYLTGMVVAAIAKRADAPLWLIAASGAGASLFPFSWFFSGYPIDFGFVNGHVTLAVILATLLAYLGAERNPAIVYCLLAISSTLALAVWSPLVLIPGALAVVVLIRFRRELLAERGILRWFAVAGTLQLVLFGFAVVLPSLLVRSSILGLDGAAFPFRKIMLPALAVAALALALIAFRKLTDLVVLGIGAIIAGAAVGMGILLFAFDRQGNLWTYYPLKYLWLTSTILFVLLVGVAVAAASRASRETYGRVVSGVLIAIGSTTFLGWTTSSVPTYILNQPAYKILSGKGVNQTDGNAAPEAVVQFAGSDVPHLLWQSNDPVEAVSNFWMLILWENQASDNSRVSQYAYSRPLTTASDVCTLLGLFGKPAVVHTAQPSKAAELQAECQDAEFTVVPYSP